MPVELLIMSIVQNVHAWFKKYVLGIQKLVAYQLTRPFIFYILTYTDSDTDHESSPSNSLQDLSQQSAKVATLVSFNLACLQDLGVKTHLIPIAKRLGVKFRSLGKRALLIPIARQLFEQGFLKVECADVDYKHLKRSQISVCKPISNLSPSSSSGSSDIDSSEGFDVSEASPFNSVAQSQTTIFECCTCFCSI